MINSYKFYSIDVTRGGNVLPRFLLLLLIFMCVIRISFAEPYVPVNKNMILEVLPTKITPLLSHIEKLENEYNKQVTRREDTGSSLAVNENNAVLLESLIDAYIEQAKISADMRYISYAQYRLKPWLSKSPDAETVRLLTIKVQQFNHEFEKAIDGLGGLLRDFPENTEAWSILANLQLLTGDYASANGSCRQLSKRGSLTDAVICQCNILIRTGSLNKAEKALGVLLAVNKKLPNENLVWLQTSMAEISLQKDEVNLATSYIKDVMGVVDNEGIYDSYLLRMYVDLLIRSNDLTKAYDLVKNNRKDSALMIRAAVIAKKINLDAKYKELKVSLRQSFDVEKRRGGVRHLREQSLFLLLIQKDVEEAYRLAKLNWKTQKEPEDARVLLKSALAMDNLEIRSEAIALINKTGLIDARLNILSLSESII